MEAFLAERAPTVAFYSEDRGMVSPAGGEAEWVLVVDPIDGTRPALAGFESSCVSVAAAPLDGEPTMADVSRRLRGRAEERPRLRRRARGRGRPPSRRSRRNTAIERMFWVYGFRGRPGPRPGGGAGRADRRLLGRRRELRPGLGHLRHDARHHRPARRLHRAGAADDRGRARDAGGVRAGRRRARSSTTRPYDLAAATLCLQEAGAIVTDAYGRGIGDRPLLGSSHEFQISCLAVANAELHSKICAAIDAGIERLAARG